MQNRIVISIGDFNWMQFYYVTLLSELTSAGTFLGLSSCLRMEMDIDGLSAKADIHNYLESLQIEIRQKMIFGILHSCVFKLQE